MMARLRWLVLVAVLAVALACGKPAAEPAAPAAEVAGEAGEDAAVLYPDARPAVAVDRGPETATAGSPLFEPPTKVGDRMPPMPPPPCDDQALRAEELDLNADGAADVRKVFIPGAGGEWLGCKLADLDLDGDWDMAALFDERGGRTVEYMDFDFDGRLDAATLFDPGGSTTRLTARDLDGDGLVDAVSP